MDCGQTSYSITKETNYFLILKIKACTKAGIHSISIIIDDDDNGNVLKSYYKVYPSQINQIILFGLNGVIGKFPHIRNQDTIYINHLEELRSFFIYKENIKLILDFNITDKYGNLVIPKSPSTFFNLKQFNEVGDRTTSSSNLINYSLKLINKHYQMIISIKKIGTYQIEKNKYISKAIKFDILPGEVNPNISFCILRDYLSSKILLLEQRVELDCYLRDKYGNEINIKNFKFQFYL